VAGCFQLTDSLPLGLGGSGNVKVEQQLTKRPLSPCYDPRESASQGCPGWQLPKANQPFHRGVREGVEVRVPLELEEDIGQARLCRQWHSSNRPRLYSCS
jgi:hypothetical protein